MRCIVSITFLLLLFNTSAEAQKKTFMRLYSLQGKKFAKGFYSGVTDTSILVINNNETTEVPVSKIGVIKLRRAPENGILIGSTIGAATFGTIGLVTGKPQDGSSSLTPWTGFKVGVFFGGLIGGLAGSLVYGLKKKISFTINGSTTLWQEQRKAIEQLPSLNK